MSLDNEQEIYIDERMQTLYVILVKTLSFLGNSGLVDNDSFQTEVHDKLVLTYRLW